MNILKSGERAALFCLVSLMFVFCSGCVEMTMKTRIMADGRCSESMIITTSSMFAEGIKSEMDKKDLSREGYRVEQKIDGDKVHMSLSRDFGSVKDMYKARQIDPVAGVNGEGGRKKPQGDLKVEDLFFVKTMTFREVMPKPDKTHQKEPGSARQMDEMQRRLAQGMFSFRRVIEMPGPILSSNADSIDKAANTATWNVPFDKLEDGAVFEVKSQIVNIPGIIITAIVVLAAVIGAVAALVAGRKRKAGQENPAAE